MAQDHCVIIGNGTAGNEAALRLRDNSPDVRITVIGQELVGSYSPHLLPDFIAGTLPEDDLYVFPKAFYKERDVKLRLGQRVVSVDFDKKELTLEHKEVISFSGLIIACGGAPRIPEPLAQFADHMLTLKTVADAKKWVEKLAHTDRVLLAGGDLTSLSLTRTLLAMGKSIDFILCEDSFWPVRLTPEVRAVVAGKLTEKGVNVLDCAKIRRVTAVGEHRLEVETDVRTFQVGVLGAFYGLVPDVKFLAKTGLGIERGILVDEYLKTRFDRVYAAGDCAQIYNPAIRDYWVSIGYRNARNLGRIAALNLLGGMNRADVAPESIFQVDEIKINTSWWTEF
jgi:NAD(P)H-nitrite reductase large subunit